MNCAYHADQSAVAYCRTCGKALCANCTRPVRGVIYCEDCLGARMDSAAPAPGFVAGPNTAAPPAGAVPLSPRSPSASASGPNPTVAGILGAIPFGVGAVYNGQYAKGLAHLCIFALLVAGCNSRGDLIPTLSGFGIAFLVIYSILDAVRSARAIQAGLPAPDPYGLAATFGGTAKVDASKVPMAAIVLILLGVIFLLHTAGLFERGFDRFWPLLLMGLGAFLFARNYGPGGIDRSCGRRRLNGPVMLFTIGTLLLLETLDIAGFHKTWPVILLVVGGIKLLERSTMGGSANAGYGGTLPPPDVPTPPAPPAAPSTPSEVNHG